MVQDRRPIVITGAAGLVGQNLIPRLKARHAGPLIAIDKHPANTKTLARLHPDIRLIEADLSHARAWAHTPAQRGARGGTPFPANRGRAPRRVRAAARAGGVKYLVHVGSWVAAPQARVFYPETKKAQGARAGASAFPACILRPTLM